MRLGVLLQGIGAHAAAGVGVLSELERRGILPYAICGMHAGAWPAALHMAGYGAARMDAALLQASRMGERMLTPALFPRAVLRGGRIALSGGTHMQRLLSAQAGERVMALCPHIGLFLCRSAHGGRRVIFATQAYRQEPGDIVTMQATLAFAARAAMAYPPFLTPLEWMGAPLVPDNDTAFACSQLLALGAQRVLVVTPVPSPRRTPDALEMAALCALREETLPGHAAQLCVTMPDDAGALSLSKLKSCAQAGNSVARAQLDRVFEQLGMAFCRVLPFPRASGGQ